MGRRNGCVAGQRLKIQARQGGAQRGYGIVYGERELQVAAREAFEGEVSALAPFQRRACGRYAGPGGNLHLAAEIEAFCGQEYGGVVEIVAHVSHYEADVVSLAGLQAQHGGQLFGKAVVLDLRVIIVEAGAEAAQHGVFNQFVSGIIIFVLLVINGVDAHEVIRSRDEGYVLGVVGETAVDARPPDEEAENVIIDAADKLAVFL